MKKIVLLALLFPAHAFASTSAVNVRDFGATGNGVTDDRVAIQAALDAGAGHEVYFPAGTYVVSQLPGDFSCVRVSPGTQILGESRTGTKLIMAAGVAASVQLIRVENAPDVTISTITLDGAKSRQSVDPQRHGVFTKNSPRLSLRHVTAQNFTGDGFYIYAGSDDAMVYDVLATSNDRNGLTLGGTTDITTVVKSQFLGNKAEQFDAEAGINGGSTNHVTLVGNVFDAQGANDNKDYVLTMTGATSTTRSSYWTVTDNTVNGAALILWITDVVYARNHGVNPSTLPAVVVYRNSDRIRIANNTLSDTGTTTFDTGGIVHILGAETQPVGSVIVEDNTLSTVPSAWGVVAISAREVKILNNTVIGAGHLVLNEAGVFVRAVRDAEPVENVVVRGNAIRNFGNYGVILGGNVTPKIRKVDITGNTFADTSAVATMRIALNLNDGDNEALDVTVSANALSGGTTTLLDPAHLPGGTAGPINGTQWVIP